MIIACTGHRPDKLGGEYNHTGKYSGIILDVMMRYINKLKPEKVISGMALGADSLWIMAAINTNTPFIAAVPFEGQEMKWPMKSQNQYSYWLTKACEIVYVCEGKYAAWKMQKRNEWMVDNCDLLLAIWNGSKGGTKSCLDYAASKGMTEENGKVIRFDPSKI